MAEILLRFRDPFEEIKREFNSLWIEINSGKLKLNGQFFYFLFWERDLEAWRGKVRRVVLMMMRGGAERETDI